MDGGLVHAYLHTSVAKHIEIHILQFEVRERKGTYNIINLYNAVSFNILAFIPACEHDVTGSAVDSKNKT